MPPSQLCCLLAHLHLGNWRIPATLHGVDETDYAALWLCTFIHSGDLAGVQWLSKQGVPWAAATAAAAAGAGQLRVLQFLQAQGCCIDVGTANAAARTGQLPVLRWMRQHWLQGQLEPGHFAASCCQVSTSCCVPCYLPCWLPCRVPCCMPSITRRGSHSAVSCVSIMSSCTGKPRLA